MHSVPELCTSLMKAINSENVASAAQYAWYTNNEALRAYCTDSVQDSGIADIRSVWLKDIHPDVLADLMLPSKTLENFKVRSQSAHLVYCDVKCLHDADDTDIHIHKIR